MMTNSRKIEVLKLVKEEYKQCTEEEEADLIGLCDAAYWVYEDLKISKKERDYLISLAREKAIKQGYMYSSRGEKKRYNPNRFEIRYTWPIKHIQSRIDFLDREIKKLKNER